MSFFQHLQKLDIPGVVVLAQLTPRNGSKIYFSPNPGVVFNKIPYIPIGFDIDSIKLNSTGEFSKANFTIFDQDYVVSTLIEDQSLNKATLELYLTAQKFLDGQPTANPAAYSLLQKFRVSQILELVYGEYIKASLSNFDWLERPIGRLCVNKCTVEYRGSYCRYAGRYYDINNRPTNDPDQDDCDGSLTACNIRHNNGLLPWKGFLINRG